MRIPINSVICGCFTGLKNSMISAIKKVTGKFRTTSNNEEVSAENK